MTLFCVKYEFPISGLLVRVPPEAALGRDVHLIPEVLGQDWGQVGRGGGAGGGRIRRGV